METITTQELKQKIDSGNKFELIDVLPKESYEGRHLPKAKSIPVNELADRAEKELSDKEKEVVVYCASKECQASPTAAKKLIEMGYKKVVDFEDGLAGWQDAGFDFE